MRVVITGASGNVGTAVLRRLAGLDETVDVVGIARRPPDGDDPLYGGVTWHGLDLADPGDTVGLPGVLEGADAVVHLAWGFQPSHDTAYLERTGVHGTRAVVAAAELAGVGHLVHMSSVGAYSPGARGRRVDESWPTEGIPTLAYSRHKVAAERALDALEERQARRGEAAMRVARLRPGLIVQRDAGSALLRYGVPALVPADVLRWLPLLPLDDRLVVPAVHSDDVADAVVRVLQQRATGAFNLSSDPPITRADLAGALGARGVGLPAPVLRGAAAAAWHARLQPVDPGWLDLVFSVPLLDTTRARSELGWGPTVDARAAVQELVGGMLERAGTASPALRPRSVVAQVRRLVTRGPVSERELP